MDYDLTPREEQRIRSFNHCRKRIERKMAGDPGSNRFPKWQSRLDEYEMAEKKIILGAQLRAMSVAPTTKTKH